MNLRLRTPLSLRVSLGMNLSHRLLEDQVIEGDKHKICTPLLWCSQRLLCMTTMTLTLRTWAKELWLAETEPQSLYCQSFGDQLGTL